MCIAYQGNLVAFMTNPGIQEPLDTPAKVIQKNIPIGMYNYQGSTTLSFQATRNEEYKELWRRKHWITSFSDAYEKTVKGEMVFVDYRVSLDAAKSAIYIDALGRPKLYLANFNTFRFGTGWAIQPRSMYIERFNDIIKEMDMTGHLIFWKKKMLFERKNEVWAAK